MAAVRAVAAVAAVAAVRAVRAVRAVAAVLRGDHAVAVAHAGQALCFVLAPVEQVVLVAVEHRVGASAEAGEIVVGGT